jgi:hypothetical protein
MEASIFPQSILLAHHHPPPPPHYTFTKPSALSAASRCIIPLLIPLNSPWSLRRQAITCRPSSSVGMGVEHMKTRVHSFPDKGDDLCVFAYLRDSHQVAELLQLRRINAYYRQPAAWRLTVSEPPGHGGGPVLAMFMLDSRSTYRSLRASI